MTDCLSLINEVCMEAKSAGDTELQAEFLTQAVILGLQEKHLKADIITNLQVERKLCPYLQSGRDSSQNKRREFQIPLGTECITINMTSSCFSELETVLSK